ncbi:MAG TPA: DUF1343 domain-containing protein [Vicinamibacteria bacterium]|nr:DUF1343 domain-containing protein [Vicinamibacteria bacterium]
MPVSLRTGLDRLLDEEFDRIAGRPIGLIANPTTVDASFRHAIELIRARPEARLEMLFGPEHGIRSTAQDLVEVEDGLDPVSGLPVVSLYGPTRVPSEKMLSGLDAVVFDVQDVGARYYTYVWTMAHAMEACARDGKELIVLDRPNPIGGILVEGNVIEGSHLSFVGLYPVPNRHGMTVGELARFANDEFGINCRLTVVAMEGWKRSQWFDETGLPWILPSPNMPTLDTATVYPGACLLEGTNLSEGRGTTRPFEIMGAPWIDGAKLAAALDREHLPGVVFRPVAFEPTFQKFAGERCGGIQQHVVDREAYRPVRTGYAILLGVRRLWPNEFSWRPPPYEYELERPPIDILAGNTRIRELIERDAPLSEIEGSWQVDLARFKKVRERYLLYD